MDAIETFNRQLFLALNASPETPGLLLAAAKFIANGLIMFIPFLLAGLWLWGGDGRRSAVLKAILVTIVSLGASFLVGLIWYHPRPLGVELGHTYFSHRLDASFPSDHATVFFAIGFALLKNETRLFGRAMLFSGVLVGWARVFLGVHFPLDILGALAVASGVCYGVSPLWDKIGKTVTGYFLGIYKVVLAPLIARGWIRP
jgi:undecaprenyl-diphosphatase